MNYSLRELEAIEKAKGALAIVDSVNGAFDLNNKNVCVLKSSWRDHDVLDPRYLVTMNLYNKACEEQNKREEYSAHVQISVYPLSVCILVITDTGEQEFRVELIRAYSQTHVTEYRVLETIDSKTATVGTILRYSLEEFSPNEVPELVTLASIQKQLTKAI